MMSGNRGKGRECGQLTLFAYGATKPKKMKLQDDRDIASHEPESTLNEDSGTESGESNTDRDSDDYCLPRTTARTEPR